MEQVLRIGGAAREAGVSAGTIRNYDTKGLLEIPRDNTGVRVFTAAEVRRIKAIRRTNQSRIEKRRQTKNAA